MERLASVLVVCVVTLLSSLPVSAQQTETFTGQPRKLMIDSTPPVEVDVLETLEGTYPLKPVLPWQHLPPGTQIEVPGHKQDGVIIVPDPGKVKVLPKAVPQIFQSPVPGTTGPQRTLAILTRYSNPVVLPYTQAQWEVRLAGEVNAWLQRTSYGQTWLTGLTDETPDVTPWLTIASTNGTCTVADSFTWANQAKAAAVLTGYDPSAYDRVLIALPANLHCNWLGQALLGGPTIWFNGTVSTQTIVHEFGHSFFLRHSQGYDCRPDILDESCTIKDVGDLLDVMGRPLPDETGSNGLSPYNSVQRDRLGWFDDVRQTIGVITSSGVYHLDPYTSPGAGIKAWKVHHPTAISPESWYYVQMHQPVGDDAYLEEYADLTAGVQVHVTNPTEATTIFWLDMHPETTRWRDAALVPGERYDDPGGTLAVRVLEADATGARIAVIRAEDTLSLQLLTPWQDTLHHGDTLRIELRVLIGTQPAAGALWEWGFTIPHDPTLYRPPDETLGPDGIWRFEHTLTPDLPPGLYTIYARVSWEDQQTDIVSAQLTLQP